MIMRNMMQGVMKMAEIADEHLGIIQEALEDYRRRFDGSSESDAQYRRMIDRALCGLWRAT